MTNYDVVVLCQLQALIFLLNYLYNEEINKIKVKVMLACEILWE